MVAKVDMGWRSLKIAVQLTAGTIRPNAVSTCAIGASSADCRRWRSWIVLQVIAGDSEDEIIIGWPRRWPGDGSAPRDRRRD